VRRAGALLLLLATAGCGGREAFTRDAAALVGQPETALIDALGVPLRGTEAGGRRFVEYDLTRWPAPLSIASGVGGRFAAADALALEPRPCTLTFELAGGAVRGFSFRGDGCSGPLPRATRGGE